MEPITLQEALASQTVLVELLADRDYKDDCQAHTGIVWRGKGDRQRYPAKLWPKLAAHPTVWALVPEEGLAPPSSQTPEELARAAGLAEADRVRQASEAAAGRKTDLVHVSLVDGAGSAKLGDVYDYSVLTAEAQASMAHEQMHELAAALGYGAKGTGEPAVHPRLGEVKLRPLFAEITASRLAKMPKTDGSTANAAGLGE